MRMISRFRTLAPALLLAAMACAGTAPPAAAPAPATPPAATARTGAQPRWDVRPLPVPRGYARALAAGTRTPDGRPGPNYWQQRVDYDIDATLDPKTAVVNGSEQIEYHNNSPDTLHVIVFRLYQNIFAPGVQRRRTVPITGGMTLSRVEVAGESASAVTPRRARPRARPPTGPVYLVNGTIMVLRLAQPLTPGDSLEMGLDWSFEVPPPGAPRTGRIDHDLFNVAQWYPQVSVYDDIDGWDTWPYYGNGEFYLEYGDFDVSLTLPEGWVVGATGTLQNPGDVLTAEERARLAAASADSVVHVVTSDDFGPGNATTQAPGGELTWRFHAAHVRDFAWVASDQYLWDVTRAAVGDATGAGHEDTIRVNAFYRPSAHLWRQAARYAQQALEYHVHGLGLHPYIYPQATVAEGPIGGMEYPMMVFVREFGNAHTDFDVINHELGHEWFPMMVGSNETYFGWQDEGVDTYTELYTNADFFHESADSAFADDRRGYLRMAGSDEEVPMMRKADLFGPYAAYGVGAYEKPAVVLRQLEEVVGRDALLKALDVYSDRWLLKHPQPLDFFHTIESVTGRKLDWYFYPWWYTTGTADQAIASVRATTAGAGQRVTVTIDDRGDAPLPVDLLLTTSDGHSQEVHRPASVWLGGARSITETVTLPGPVARVELDPHHRLLDVDRSNNVWTRGAASGSR